MARHKFGGMLSDWALTREASTGVMSSPDTATLTFWTLVDGGEQHTDLLNELGEPADHIALGSAGVFEVGVVPEFYGPDNVWAMWMSINGGPRQLLITSEVATEVGPLADTLNSAYTAHVASRNPHGVTTPDLVDVSDTTPLNGQIQVWDTTLGLYVPTTVTGVSPSEYIHTAGNSSVTIAEANNGWDASATGSESTNNKVNRSNAEARANTADATAAAADAPNDSDIN